MAHYRRRGKTWTVYWYVDMLVDVPDIDHPDYDPETNTPVKKEFAPRQKSKGGFRTRRDAESWHIRTEAERLQGYAGAPDKLTVGTWVQRCHDTRPAGAIGTGTISTYQDQINRYIKPYIGNIPLARLDSLAVQRWHNDLLARPLAPTTVANTHAVLSFSMNRAVDNGLIPRNPCRTSPPPKAPKKLRPRLSGDEIRRFLAAADSSPHGLLYRLAIFSLMRPGELVALRWEDINWQRGTIHIHRTRRRDVDRRFYLGEGGKSASSSRTVAIHDDLMQRLRRHRVEQNTHRLRYAELWHDLGLVFCRDDGTMIREGTLANRLKKICKVADVPGMTPHGLRHSGATMMLELNEHLKVISERLGHASIATTADIYLEVSEGMQRAAANRMADALDGDIMTS